jgi:hypothetical protein
LRTLSSLLLASCFAGFLPATPAQAVVYVWYALFSEDQVKNSGLGDGSTGSVATGNGLVTFDTETRELSYEFEWRDLEADLTKLHVHGPSGPDGSTPVHLFEVFNSTAEVLDAELNVRNDVVSSAFDLDTGCPGCAFDADTALDHLLEEMAYVNVHTDLWPTGEIRGNLLLVSGPSTPNQYVWAFRSSEGQVKNSGTGDGSTDSLATGGNLLTFDTSTQILSYLFEWRNLEDDLTKLHVHGRATPEQSTPIHVFQVFNATEEVTGAGLDPRSDVVEGSFNLATDCPGCQLGGSEETLSALVDEEAYVNVHTDLWGAGEVRGNLRLVSTPFAYTWEFPIDEARVRNSGVGDGSTDSAATGQGLIASDSRIDVLGFVISWDGLEGDLTSIQVLGPAGPDESVGTVLFDVLADEAAVLASGKNRRSDSYGSSVPLSSPGGDFPGDVVLQHLVDGQAYVNVTSMAWPGGEIRGNVQLVPEPGRLVLRSVALALLAGLACLRARRRTSLRMPRR